MIDDIRKTFEKHRNKDNALGMQKYMKERFPYLGIKAPLRNEISKPFFSEVKTLTADELKKLVLQLWKLPEREYQYLAIELLKRNQKKLKASDLPFLRKLIETKSWWDSVDSLASNSLGLLLLNNPELRTEMDKWIKDKNMWIRRSAIIYQLKHKDQTDEDQLFGLCLLTCHEKEFFIRKAIGWALRQHAKMFPAEVKQFVEANEKDLSGLSIKEAMRNIS